MSVDDPFPPVDPIAPLPPPHAVFPRQRRFTDKTRRLINDLKREQKEMADREQQNPRGKTSPNEPPSAITHSKGTGIDKLA